MFRNIVYGGGFRTGRTYLANLLLDSVGASPTEKLDIHKGTETKLAKTNTSDPFLDEALDMQGDSDGGEVLDLSEVPDNIAFEVWPSGTYDGVIDDVEYGRSQKSNNPMLTWKIKVTRPSDGKERTMFHHTVLTGDGLSRTKRTLVRVAPDIDLKNFVPARASELLAGKLCQVKVKIQTYEGSRRNGISDVLPAREGQTDSFLDSE